MTICLLSSSPIIIALIPRMAPFEALYGRNCRSPICRAEVGEHKLVDLEIIQQTTDLVKLICERIKVVQS